MRKHHNRLFYGRYRYKTSFALKWAPMLYPTTDDHLQSFIDGKQSTTKYLNTKFWKATSDVIKLAKFIKQNRSKMKFRLQQTQAIFYTDKKLANQLIGNFWQDWVGSTVVDPRFDKLEENTVGCSKLPHGKYRYQIHLKKQKAKFVDSDKRQALLKFLDNNIDNVYVTNGLLIDWLEGKDYWYPASYFYVTEEKFLSPLYVIAGDMIDKVIKFERIKNGSDKKIKR
tara:strand:- start:14739 stop:15416 length:678 start_codon:yes stop_codon:yes gene_type:complete